VNLPTALALHQAVLMRVHERTVPALVRALVRSAAAHRTLDLAAQLAFYSVLGLFPFAIFLATLLGFLPIAGLDAQLLVFVERVAPRPAAPLVVAAARQAMAGARPLWLALGLGGAIVAASGAVAALMKALNRAYDVVESRSWLAVRLRALAVTVVGAALIIVAVTALISGPRLVAHVAAALGVRRAFAIAWRIARWPATAATMAALLAFLYRTCPDVRRPRVLPGALAGAPAWIVVSLGFNEYVVHFSTFNRTYGALAAGIVLMLWFQLSSAIVLLGGELNALVGRAARLHRRREPALIVRWLRGRRRRESARSS